MLYPFEAVLSINEEKSGAHAVMTSFNRVGCEWAGASENLLENILIKEWGFDGYNITDMASSNGASYMTYQDGVMLGTNVFLGSGSENALDSFKNNATFANKMRESTKRVLYAVANYSYAMNGLTPDTVVEQSAWWWKTLLITVEVVFGVLTAAAAAMYAISTANTSRIFTDPTTMRRL